MPVIQAISRNLPATLLLMTSSIALALAVGAGRAGRRRLVKVRTVWDTLVSDRRHVLQRRACGIMLIVLFSVKLGWLPVGGMATIGGADGGVAGVLDILHHLILPTLALGLFYAAIYADHAFSINSGGAAISCAPRAPSGPSPQQGHVEPNALNERCCRS